MNSNPVRVLHVITKVAIGGAQMNTLLSCKYLSRKGFPSVIAAGPEKPPEGDYFNLADKWGIHIEIIPHLKRRISPFADFRALLELKQYMKKGGFRIVHTHGSKAKILGRIAAKWGNCIPVVQTIHGWPFYDKMNPLVLKAYVILEKLFLGLADRTIAVTDRDIEKGLKFGIGKLSDYQVIRSGVEFDPFRSQRGCRRKARELMGIDADLPVVGTVMRLCHQKNPEIFISAAKITASIVKDAVFVVIGDGPLRGMTEKWISEAGLKNRFLLMGSRKDIENLLPGFDVFLLSSRFEGLPRSVLESLASGVPVVATDVDGIPEILCDGRNGFICPIDDYNALAEKVSLILQNPDISRQLLEKVDRDLEPFSAEKMIDDLFHLYSELVKTT